MMLAEHVSIVYVAGVECGRAMEAASSGDVGSVLHVSGLPLTATEQTVTALFPGRPSVLYYQYKNFTVFTNIVRAVQSKLRNSKNHFGVDTRCVNVYSCHYKTSFPDHP